MPSKQRTFGQFETPPEVADLLLSLCIRRASDRVLDPSCGSGYLLQRTARWQAWLAADEQNRQDQLWGVELDDGAAAHAQERLPGAHILHQNFFMLEPAAPFDAIVGNPPYTRAEWIDRLREHPARQMAMFGAEAHAEEETRSAIIPAHLWEKDLNRRSGLHAYFLLHGARFLREGGRFGFVLPNNWLDVAYGEALKQFLLEQFKVLALIESTAERWFADARVNTCLAILEKCSDRQARDAHLVRFVQLREPLTRLVPFPTDHRARFSAVETLTTRLLPGQDHTSQTVRVRVVQQNALRAREKWGLLWRAPAVYRHARRYAAARGLVPLKQWARVQRGFTTGANGFFYLDPDTVEKWSIEARFRQPLLKSLRDVNELRPGIDPDLQVLLIPPDASLARTAAGEYVAWGEAQGFHERSTCHARQPWYALPAQDPAALVLAKGIWGRHLAPLLVEPCLVDQQLYQVQLHPGIAPALAAALLNSSWTALQLELHGRVNFGEGVLWLANYEVENLLLPDARSMARETAAQLAARFEALSHRAVLSNLRAELAQVDRQALDEAVFAALGLSPTEGTIVLETLVERVDARQVGKHHTLAQEGVRQPGRPPSTIT